MLTAAIFTLLVYLKFGHKEWTYFLVVFFIQFVYGVNNCLLGVFGGKPVEPTRLLVALGYEDDVSAV